MIVKMKKLNIVGLISEKKKVLDILRSTGCFELCNLSDVSSLNEASIDRELYESLHHKLHTLQGAIEDTERARLRVLDELKQSKALFKRGEIESIGLKKPREKKPLFFYKTQISAEEMEKIGQCGDDILQKAQAITNQWHQIEQIDLEFEQNKADCQMLEIYKNVDVNLSEVRDSKHLFMLLGTVNKKDATKLAGLFETKEGFSVRQLAGDAKRDIVFVSGAISQKQRTLTQLSQYNFQGCKYNADSTPAETIQSLKRKNNDIYQQKLQLLDAMANDAEGIHQLKAYYDYVALEIEALDAQKSMGETKNAFCIEGWIPAENAKEITQKLLDASSCIECEVLDTQDNDEPPTLTRSNALISPYESITNMYSPPSPFERDPNPFVGFFFFIFFGIMIGDAVYGVALFALTFVLIKCFKMETGFKKLLMILCMGGVSAFVWGAVYNSWAAVGLPYNPLINPVEHPFDFLIISLGLGYVQIIFGYVLKLIANLRAKDVLSAFADSGWKLLIMIGGALNIPLALGIFENQFAVLKIPALPSVVCYIGLGLIGVGLLGMLITGGRHKKTVAGKILSGVGSWYDLVGVISDILSYCRLFGLALSGAIIGTVANILAKDVLFNIPVAGYALGIIVAVFFHIFNLALACLGAYVHNSRLQFVEFFGKFYEGGGRLFKPMGHCTKYTSIKR